MLQIRSFVERVGRCAASEVVRYFSEKYEFAATDANAKRNIYRDLNDFVSSGEMKVDYFSPSGQKIELYDEAIHKNVRAEYFLANNNDAVFSGAGYLKEQSIRVILPEKRILHLRASYEFEEKENYFVLSIRPPAGRLLNFYLPSDELPIKILVSRAVDKKESPFNLQRIEQQFGFRTLQFFLPDMSLSSAKAPDRFGHFLIETNKGAQTVSIFDLNSSDGTFVRNIDQNDTTLLAGSLGSDKTMPIDRLQKITNPPDWLKIESALSAKPLPTAVRAGQTLFFIHHFGAIST